MRLSLLICAKHSTESGTRARVKDSIFKLRLPARLGAQGLPCEERRFGSFERALRIPDTVDADKIEASFKKGVLTVTLPKTAEAQKPVKKIEVKGG